MKKRIISFAASLSLIGSVIAPINALADEETTASFTGDGYTVTYEVKSGWVHNQNVEVTLTNTSNEPLLNWALIYNAQGEINGIWNGVIFDSNESSYVIKNSGYNYEILPEDSVTFGYTLTGDELDIPESITLCSQREDVDAESYSVSLSVSDDWGSGFNGLITIENLSDRPIEAWRLGFDANFEISNVWNAQLLSSDNNSYSVCSDITTTPIGVGETKTFGFAAVKDQDSIPEITNTSLSEVAINADLTDHNDDSSEIDDSSSEYSDDSSSENDDSSETDSSDVSSESDSSDESSEYEEPVVRPQTYTYEVRNEDCAVDEITVSMETAGDLEGTTTIENIMDKDIMCSGVVGLFGEPFDIETSAEFSSAVLTFKVDKSMLGDTEFDNLLFLWYDEENENFVELDTEHDEENSTVSTTVTHFSKYMIVDAKAWFENWNSIAEFMRTLLHPTSTGICISCSDVNDPLFNCDLDMIINGTASIETPNNYRKLILAQLIEIMKPGDLMFHIYGQTSRYGVLTSSSDLTEDKETLMTLDYQCSPSVEEIACILIESHDKYWGKEKYNVYNKRTVIITDHDMSVAFEKLDPYYHYIMEIPVYFFCIGDFETPGLQNIVDHCGGDIYKVTTLSEFTDMLQKWGADKICGEKDYDHDGFSDVEEINGLIYDQSGNLVYTDYQKEDSDDDGLYDWQEVEVEMTVEETVVGKFSSTKYYHKMHSNPMLKDGDGDGLYDPYDYAPLDAMTEDERVVYDFFENAEDYEAAYLGDFCNRFECSPRLAIEYIDTFRKYNTHDFGIDELMQDLEDKGFSCDKLRVEFYNQEYQNYKSGTSFAELMAQSYTSWADSIKFFMGIWAFGISAERCKSLSKWDYTDEYKLSLEEEQIAGKINEYKKLGKTTSIRSANETNVWLKEHGDFEKPPYDPKTKTTTIKLYEDTDFVRVYKEGETSPAGQWIMKRDEIEGLTPFQIKDKFALKYLPDHIVDVKVPAGTEIRFGIANEISGWGHGGGIQFDLMGQRINGFGDGKLL